MTESVRRIPECVVLEAMCVVLCVASDASYCGEADWQTLGDHI